MQFTTAIQTHLEAIVQEARNEAEGMNFINATAEGTFIGYYLAKSVDKWYSRKDFAEAIGVSVPTVTRAIDNGVVIENCGRIYLAQFGEKVLTFLNKKTSAVTEAL